VLLLGERIKVDLLPSDSSPSVLFSCMDDMQVRTESSRCGLRGDTSMGKLSVSEIDGFYGEGDEIFV
jgi:hypothetical protein